MWLFASLGFCLPLFCAVKQTRLGYRRRMFCVSPCQRKMKAVRAGAVVREMKERRGTPSCQRWPERGEVKSSRDFWTQAGGQGPQPQGRSPMQGPWGIFCCLCARPKEQRSKPWNPLPQEAGLAQPIYLQARAAPCPSRPRVPQILPVHWHLWVQLT